MLVNPENIVFHGPRNQPNEENQNIHRYVQKNRSNYQKSSKTSESPEMAFFEKKVAEKIVNKINAAATSAVEHPFPVKVPKRKEIQEYRLNRSAKCPVTKTRG
ncbi:MAG: hypothetical protein GY702_00290 [Desulfobulbaceae bacterium]|nr:hypothetical protein [Desulfobulbaceae bacterium]